LEKRQRQIKQEIQNNISELDSTRLTKEEVSKEFYDIQLKKNKVTEELQTIAKKKEEASNKIKSFETSINTLASEIRIKESRLKFLVETEKEKEGYVKSVKSLLKDCENIKDLGKGMHGVLANIIEVPKEYETAIEMCLGMSLQNIVTETEEDAKKLVEHLRKNNLGRASFLPISSVKGKKLEKIKGKEQGVIGIASDLVKYNKKYEQIVLNLLGRTVIVDNMDTAIKVAKNNSYTFRIITLDGDLINPSGAITGGSVAKKTVNILGRGREIEIEYATKKQKLDSIESEIQKIEARLEKLKKETADLDINKENCKKEKENSIEKTKELTEEIEKLNKVITEFAETNKDNQKYIDDLNFDITNLKISVSSFDESEASIEEIVERINLETENTNKSIENKKNQIEQIIQENGELENSIDEINNKITEIKQDVENSGSKIEELKQDRVEKNKKLENQEKEISDKFHVIEDLKAQIVKIDVKKTKLEDDINSIINKMWEEYELTPNNVGEVKKPDNVQKTQRQVNNLRTDIKELGSVNVDSIEEYKNLKERYEFMSAQAFDLEETMAKLRKIISEMTTIMKEQFKTQFEIINKNFSEVFKELFGGGQASLKLADEENILECGIDITVQPPGKKLQNMMLLSGGEKAFTAIALLFAILKINPAPFCVLDEIEAALDDVNVFRYAEYLKKFSNETQFLVITHRKGSMEAADTVYGVTMEENGISKLLSMKLK
ncbi:MAG: AAA family ATPase, partial [Clostridia bacterium]|nr:AAA family ATPase [Clostridia bacterium]